MKDYVRGKLLIRFFPLIVKIVIIAFVLIFLLILTIGIVQMAIESSEESDNVISYSQIEGGNKKLPESVEQYRDVVKSEAESQGLGEYTDVLLALMMQESGGNGNDPMQSSESYCGGIGCIDNPDLSISQGVKYFKSVMTKANNDIKLALQSYNFGEGFIGYVADNGGSYTKELAISFSQMMYEKVRHTGMYRCNSSVAIANSACYGDVNYVDSVLKYASTSTSTNGSMSEELNGLHSPLAIPLIKNSGYGWRIHPIFKTRKLHAGIDLDCTTGDSVHAVMDGVVVKSDTFGNVALGEYVKIQHSPTNITTYGHLSQRLVSENTQVVAGEEIGKCGNTGGSTGAHLHFEIQSSLWTGQVDPAKYLGM